MLICIFAYVCVFLHTSYWLYPCAALLRLSHAARRVTAEPTQFTGRADLFHLFTTVWPEVTWSSCCFENDRASSSLSRQTSLIEDGQCCESWRDAELWHCAVCAVRNRLETRGESGSESPSDTTGEVLMLVRSVVLLVFRHIVTLPWAVWRTICWPHPVQLLIATTTDTRHHWPFAVRPTTPAVRFVAVVYYAVATTRLLFCACCLPLATSFGWHSRFYTML